MKALFHQKGARLDINFLATDKAQDFIETHAGVLDSTFEKTPMSERMRQRLTRSNYIFSGMKTFHELNEAFPSLLDENGDRKPFERFLNDVRTIDETYNKNYLRAEYNFVHQSAQMAAKWERFSEDGDRYLLQYRTAGDDKVRPEHAALNRITLPMGDPFWETYYPPNGWNCRCTVVQVLKSMYEPTPHAEAMDRGKEALDGERYNIFRFNSGKQQKAVPDYNPYTIKRCDSCDIAKGGSVKLSFVPDYDLCQGCIMVRKCYEERNRDNSAKATRKSPDVKKLQGTTISNPDFKHEVLVSGGSIREWTNQPHKAYAAKNSILKHIAKIFREAKYIGAIDNFKQTSGVLRSHLFETTALGEAFWIIVREYEIGDFILHSLSDGERIKTGIKKE